MFCLLNEKKYHLNGLAYFIALVEEVLSTSSLTAENPPGESKIHLFVNLSERIQIISEQLTKILNGEEDDECIKIED